MGRGLIGSVNVAPVLCQDYIKQLDGFRSAFISPIIPETHVVGTLDQILYDSFPEEVGEGHPIDLHLSIALKKRISVWWSDKEEIALFGGQHHLIPIDHKHLTRSIPDQISCMQVGVTDDAGQWSLFLMIRQLLRSTHDRLCRGRWRRA